MFGCKAYLLHLDTLEKIKVSCILLAGACGMQTVPERAST